MKKKNWKVLHAVRVFLIQGVTARVVELAPVNWA